MDAPLDEILAGKDMLLAKSAEFISKARENALLMHDENARTALMMAADFFEKTLGPFDNYFKNRAKRIEELEREVAELNLTNSEAQEALDRKLASMAEANKQRKEKYAQIKLPGYVKKKPVAPPKKSPYATLLSPQELRDQIARKIERPPTPPQTTGNIWENWSKTPQTPAPPAGEENQP